MTATTPVLLIGFNRPEKMERLIGCIRQSRPPLVLVAVDGPRSHRPDDGQLVAQTRDAVALIDWDARIETRFRTTNLGLERAVTDAVSWAVSSFGSAIICEDDVMPGTYALPYMFHVLERFREESRVAHVNGYNLVPPEHLHFEQTQSRLTRYIESYCWATWEDRWKHYDHSLEWAMGCSVDDLGVLLGGKAPALRWKINFRDTYVGNIDSWAYRWMATMWSKGWMAIAPNSNLSTYGGHDSGTHTRRKPRWTELALATSPPDSPRDVPAVDEGADDWTARTVFRESPWGILDGLVTSSVLSGIRLINRGRS